MKVLLSNNVVFNIDINQYQGKWVNKSSSAVVSELNIKIWFDYESETIKRKSEIGNSLFQSDWYLSKPYILNRTLTSIVNW